MKKVFCTLMILAGILVLLSFVLTLVVSPLLYDRPQLPFAKDFIETNEVVEDLVGRVSDIELDKQNSRVSVMSNRTEGSYDFRVAGRKGEAIIRISWASTSELQTNFVATGLWLVKPNRQAMRMWP